MVDLCLLVSTESTDYKGFLNIQYLFLLCNLILFRYNEFFRYNPYEVVITIFFLKIVLLFQYKILISDQLDIKKHFYLVKLFL